jgi:hypothetical protein
LLLVGELGGGGGGGEGFCPEINFWDVLVGYFWGFGLRMVELIDEGQFEEI